MKNVAILVVVSILSLLMDYSLALQIGAFNTGVYGQTKSSKPEVVSIIVEVDYLLGYSTNYKLH